MDNEPLPPTLCKLSVSIFEFVCFLYSLSHVPAWLSLADIEAESHSIVMVKIAVEISKSMPRTPVSWLSVDAMLLFLVLERLYFAQRMWWVFQSALWTVWFWCQNSEVSECSCLTFYVLYFALWLSVDWLYLWFLWMACSLSLFIWHLHSLVFQLAPNLVESGDYRSHCTLWMDFSIWTSPEAHHFTMKWQCTVMTISIQAAVSIMANGYVIPMDRCSATRHHQKSWIGHHLKSWIGLSPMHTQTSAIAKETPKIIRLSVCRISKLRFGSYSISPYLSSWWLSANEHLVQVNQLRPGRTGPCLSVHYLVSQTSLLQQVHSIMSTLNDKVICRPIQIFQRQFSPK